MLLHRKESSRMVCSKETDDHAHPDWYLVTAYGLIASDAVYFYCFLTAEGPVAAASRMSLVNRSAGARSRGFSMTNRCLVRGSF